MYKCMNNEGDTLATYETESAARAFWVASEAYSPITFDPNVREQEITVFDVNNVEVGSIKLPKTE